MKTIDQLTPEEFDHEYGRWLSYALDYDWWEGVQDMFTQDCKELGVSVENIYFDQYSTGFIGWVDVAEYMRHSKLDEQYLVLYLAVKQYGLNASAASTSRRYASVSTYAPLDTVPCGVFADLDEGTWVEMVENQWLASDMERMLQEFVDDLCSNLRRMLTQEEEYLTSEEEFRASCEANEVEFDYEVCD